MEHRWPALHPKSDGMMLVRSTGACYFLDFWWFQGAKIAYALATAKGFIAWRIWNVLPTKFAFGRLGMALLPSAGDWIWKDNDGRCSSLARFIDCELSRRGLA